MTPPDPQGNRKTGKNPDGTMSILEHLDELRSRLFRCAIGFIVLFAACWAVSGWVLEWLLIPIRKHLFEDGEIVFINISEPFLIYMKAAALTALFVGAPLFLYQAWGFIAPGLYRKERRLIFPFLFFGSVFFIGGGAFAYYVAVPVAAEWLLDLGEDFTAQLTMRSAFAFESKLIIGMGAVFEMPILIFFLSRIGLVTPAFLLRHFRTAVLIIALIAAVITPTGDMLTMSVFAGPMILLYLLGVAVSWVSKKRKDAAEREGS